VISYIQFEVDLFVRVLEFTGELVVACDVLIGVSTWPYIVRGIGLQDPFSLPDMFSSRLHEKYNK
jgi:hypothetical protein